MKYMFVFLTVLFFIFGCGEKPSYVPKPRGYFKLSVPEHAYQTYVTDCPFRFEYSTHAEIKPYHASKKENPCWFDLYYSRFQATLHCTYDPVNQNLKNHIDDSQALVYKHVIKSSGIEELNIINDLSHVYGTLYNILGDPASPYQFYLTDSSRHFFRGALYFDYKPNYDSLKPILDFLKYDVDYMIQSFEWK